MEIIYRSFDHRPYFARIKAMYAEEGWCAYLGDDDKLRRAFANSLYWLGAFAGDELVGFARCVGDGEHVVLLQDLLIAKGYRRQKLGTHLLRRTAAQFADVRMFAVVTDLTDAADNAFYRAMDMRTLEEGHMVAYFRDDKRKENQ